jgi:hypothetical protein
MKERPRRAALSNTSTILREETHMYLSSSSCATTAQLDLFHPNVHCGRRLGDCPIEIVSTSSGNFLKCKCGAMAPVTVRWWR